MIRYLIALACSLLTTTAFSYDEEAPINPLLVRQKIPIIRKRKRRLLEIYKNKLNKGKLLNQLRELIKDVGHMKKIIFILKMNQL